MKNFFKKINRNQEAEQEDLNLDYSDFYMGKDSRSDRSDRAEDRREESAPEQRSAGGYYDVAKPSRGGYEEPDFQSDNTRYYDRAEDQRPTERVVERPMERPLDRGESVVRPRETWLEADAPGYRPNPATVEPEAETVFTPTPAPEYLYFTPSTNRDCREGIVKGLAAGHVVVVRLGDLEASDVLRLFDYMMGAVLALNAELVRPESTTVVLVPDGVELDEDELELDDEDEYEDDEEYEDEDEEYGEDEEYEEYDEEYEEYDEDGEYEEDADEDVE